MPIDVQPMVIPEHAGSPGDGLVGLGESDGGLGGFVRVGLDQAAAPGPGPSQPPISSNQIGIDQLDHLQLDMDQVDAFQSSMFDSSLIPMDGLSIFTIPRPIATQQTAQPSTASTNSATTSAGTSTESIPSTSKTQPTSKPKRERKKKEGHQPRPANAWILYRSAQIQKLRTDDELAKQPQSEVCKQTLTIHLSQP